MSLVELLEKIADEEQADQAGKEFADAFYALMTQGIRNGEISKMVDMPFTFEYGRPKILGIMSSHKEK